MKYMDKKQSIATGWQEKPRQWDDNLFWNLSKEKCLTSTYQQLNIIAQMSWSPFIALHLPFRNFQVHQKHIYAEKPKYLPASLLPLHAIHSARSWDSLILESYPNFVAVSEHAGGECFFEHTLLPSPDLVDSWILLVFCVLEAKS